MRKPGKLAALSVFCCLLMVSDGWAQPVAGGPDSPAATPPMGWNSYNCFGSAVHEDEVKANADYVAGH
jgi:hypothetical protein